MTGIVVWGATGHARVLREALSHSHTTIVALVDNREVVPPLVGVPVLRGEAELRNWLSNREGAHALLFTIAVGGAKGHDRLALFARMKALGLQACTIAHPTAFVANDAVLGEGCQVLAGAFVCTHCSLGIATIVNTAASVDHDCVLGDGVHVGPGARLAGEVVVGSRAFLGTGAIILPRLRIGEDAIVGAGAVVTCDVPAGATVVGNPARLLQPSIQKQ